MQVWIGSAAGQTPERYEFSQTHMGMPWKLIFYAEDAKIANLAAQRAFERVAELDRVMSDYRDDSELVSLSASAGTGRDVSVSDDLWRVLTSAQDLAAASDGAFDITVGPLTRLWRTTRRHREIPSRERIDEARASVGFRKLVLDPKRQSARLVAPRMRLDLGGIAAGDAADAVLKVLRRHGIESAMVDASGDVVVGAPPPGKDAWMIAIDDPTPTDPKRLRTIPLVQSALAVSGDLYQFVEIGGVRYSHILDPRTGWGLTTRARAVVIAPRGIDADRLATVLCVLGSSGLKLIEALPGAAAQLQWLEGTDLRQIASSSWPRSP